MLKSVSISLSDVFKLIRQNLEHTGNVKAQVEYDLFSVMKILMLSLLHRKRGELTSDEYLHCWQLFSRDNLRNL